jgi:hypothetical protein
MAQDPRVPDWLLERVALDQVPPGQADELARRMAADPTAAARLAALRASNQEILAALPPAQVAAEVERRRRLAEVAAAAPRPRTWIAASGAMAAAVAVLVMLLVPGKRDVTSEIDAAGEERAKGDPHLVIHRKRGDEAQRLERDAQVRAGDLLQIAYVAAGRAHGVIFSIDGAGVVTLHHPAASGGSTALVGKGVVELAHSYELDDAPDFERFFLVTPAPGSPSGALDVTAILDRAEALARDKQAARSAPIDLPDSMQQWSFPLRKEQQP